VSGDDPAAAGVANIHGVAVAAGEHGLLILGASGAGKSALAARMLVAWPFGAVRLVADDRVLLRRFGARIVARPHPAIAGRLEIRGFGLQDVPALEAVTLAGLIRLSATTERLPEAETAFEPLMGLRLPCAVLPQGLGAFEKAIMVWPHFRERFRSRRSILSPAS
jgi:HPr kinase/phosphorylase